MRLGTNPTRFEKNTKYRLLRELNYHESNVKKIINDLLMHIADYGENVKQYQEHLCEKLKDYELIALVERTIKRGESIVLGDWNCSGFFQRKVVYASL